MSEKSKLITEFELFRGNGGGIEAWFSDGLPERVVEVLLECEKRPISSEVLSSAPDTLSRGRSVERIFQILLFARSACGRM